MRCTYYCLINNNHTRTGWSEQSLAAAGVVVFYPQALKLKPITTHTALV